MWCAPPAGVVLEEGHRRVDEHTVCESLADPVLHLDDDAGAIETAAVDIQRNLSGGGERDADVVREEFNVDDVPSREKFVEEPDEEVLVGVCAEEFLESPVAEGDDVAAAGRAEFEVDHNRSVH